MPDNSFLYIPDITGFTEFANETEITHGQHIITELLEGIIKLNELGMIVSEVEGDAVLFYKQNDIPTFEQVVSQSEKIFVDFHERIKRMESHRICECGACRSAIKLSIKMVAHMGPIGFTEVNNIKKPYGAEVVTIHRLLKNDVPDKEYVLLSNSLAGHYNSDLDRPFASWIQPKNLSSVKQGAGTTYFGLKPLFAKVKEPEPPQPPARLANPLALSIFISQKKEKLFNLLLDFDIRKLWNVDAKEIHYNKNEINQIGTIHKCVLKDNSVVEFESFTDDFGDNTLVYGERILNIKIAKSASAFFILSDEEAGTRLRIEMHIVPLPIIGWILKKVAHFKLDKGLRIQLQHIKEIAEKKE